MEFDKRGDLLLSGKGLDDGYMSEGCFDENLVDWFLGGECFDEMLDDWFLSGECSNKMLDGFRDFRALNCEMGNSNDYEREERQKGSDDIADVLPNDPFDMEFSGTVTTFSDWIEDLEKDFALKSLGFVDSDEVDVKKAHNQLVEFNFALKSLGFVDLDEVDVEKAHNQLVEFNFGLTFGFVDFDFSEIEEIRHFTCEKYSVSSNPADDKHKSSVEDDCGDDGGGSPPDALYYVLGYLEIEDLLSVERVCKELRNAVRNDPLLWRNIHIDYPLCSTFTNDALLRLTDRAQGMLQSLSLVTCNYITGTGLMHVLERNPNLTKLGVPGCMRLDIDSILLNLRVSKSIGKPGIKHLRIGRMSGITHQHYEELKLLMGVEQSGGHKPRFYFGDHHDVFSDDERAIDIEICPRCQRVRGVYDCPLESCQGKHQSSTPSCRACTICIPRCMNCGRCLDNCDYEETFGFDMICLEEVFVSSMKCRIGSQLRESTK